MEATITSIKRFAVHDGDGIRTTVFLKGCPLKCVWCHNPEGISTNTEISYYSRKCTQCGACAVLCPSKAHGIVHKEHIFNRTLCILCGACTYVCPNDALQLQGKKYTVSELIPILTKDKAFYDKSNGGVTISGGECLMQASFCAELFKELKALGINTAADTCGYASKSEINKLIPYTDKFLYDIKAIDKDVHIRCTGQSNEMILENLMHIDSNKIPTEIRIPYVPDFNDNQIEKIGKFLSHLKHVTVVKLLPYHNYSESKYKSIGAECTLPPKMPSENELTQAAEKLSSFGLDVSLPNT